MTDAQAYALSTCVIMMFALYRVTQIAIILAKRIVPDRVKQDQ